MFVYVYVCVCCVCVCVCAGVCCVCTFVNFFCRKSFPDLYHFEVYNFPVENVTQMVKVKTFQIIRVTDRAKRETHDKMAELPLK